MKFYCLVLILILGFSSQTYAQSQCTAFLGGSISPLWTGLVKQLSASEKVYYFDRYDSKPINSGEFKSEKTYTLNLIVEVIDRVRGKFGEEVLLIGNEIMGTDGRYGGQQSHIQLKGIFEGHFEGKGLYVIRSKGALRLNPDGSLAISGFNTKMPSIDHAKNIGDFLKELLSGVQIDIYADRFNTYTEFKD